MYDFAAGKTDWFACGHPREGLSTETPWAGDLVGDAVTCVLGTRLGDARELVAASDVDFCVVVNEEGIVAGILRGNALAKDAGVAVDDVMQLGPRTIRPSRPVDALLEKRSSHGVKHWLVTTAHGKLLGVVSRIDLERALQAKG